MSRVLTIMTCGSVDDGKSTLLGRFFYETENIFSDQSKYLDILNKKYKKENIEMDYSLLLDGLIEEKEQGITIDIAFKYLKLGNKNIRIIDTPGHIEFTRNMAYAATHSQAALLLVDASKGVLSQTIKHLEILNQFDNIEYVIFCINKMDLVNYSKKKFNDIVKDLNTLIEKNSKKTYFVPMSAAFGENVTTRSSKFKNFQSLNLLEVIKSLKLQKNKNNVEIAIVKGSKIFKGERFYFIENFGLTNEKGDSLNNLNTGEKAKLNYIFSGFNSISSLKNKKNLQISFSNEIEISKGDIISNKIYDLTDSFKATIFWCSDEKLINNKRYIFKFKNKELKGFFSNKGKNQYGLKNDIFSSTIELEEKNILITKKESDTLSGFVCINELSNETVAFGNILYSLDRGSNIIKEDYYYPFLKKVPCLWLTGLPSSGKSSIAREIGKKFTDIGLKYYILDGDNLRLTINKDLGFSDSDRIENNRRITYIAKILSDSGVIPIVATVSPSFDIRNFSKSIFENKFYFLIYIKASVEECIRRDPKKLYQKNKTVNNITGIGSNYEIPDDADLTIDTEKLTLDESVKKLFQFYMNNFDN